MLCPNCQSPIQPNDKFCGECAHPLKPVTPQVETYTAKTDTTQHFNETHPTEEKPQFDFSKSSKEIALEGRHFFKDALKHHDEIINQPKSYSFGLLGTLFGAGLIIVFIATMLLLPNQIEYLSISQSEIAFKVTLAVLAFLVISIVLTYGIIRLIVKEPINFQKFLSNYILLNTISIMLFAIAWILTLMDLRIVPSILTVLGLFSLLIASVYLITKAAENYSIRIGSFYGVVLYFVAQIICLVIFLRYLYETAVMQINRAANGLLDSFNFFNNF
ncbi:zinc ribbon domain-containing protein [Macrococcus equi]|uniref:zinc ribbon domain-containing protein n=1 Tax=Macrococcus equi TaxID=3395462 RepID=UPI0039BE92B8